jgi:hypothetical protein
MLCSKKGPKQTEDRRGTPVIQTNRIIRNPSGAKPHGILPPSRRPERRRSRDAASGDKLCPTLPRSGPGRQTGCYRTRVHSATTELAYAIHPVEPAEPRVPRSTSSLTKRGTHHDREPAPGRIAPGGAECSQGRLPLGILPRPCLVPPGEGPYWLEKAEAELEPPPRNSP